jgi:hypothetical protein
VSPAPVSRAASPFFRASVTFQVVSLSLPPRESLTGAVDRGGSERAAEDASGKGAPTGGPGAGRSGVGGLSGVLSTKV